MTIFLMFLAFFIWGVAETAVAEWAGWPWYADWPIFILGCIILVAAFS